MEGELSVSSTSLYSGLKGYWRRRKKKGYERINGLGRRRKDRVEYLSGEGSRRKRSRKLWKINLKPRLKLKLNLKLRRFSPKKFLLNMRDAYVNMMMKIANSRCMSSGISGDYGGGSGFGTRQLKEYDEKVLVEIYKSMIIAQGQLIPRDGAGGGDGSGVAKFRAQIMCQQ